MVSPAAHIAILQTHSLPMLVQRELERMVLAGEIGAGARLNESELALKLGVSRGPVREALGALSETGLLRHERNRGVFVREISTDEADEILEVRASLDRLAGRKLAVSMQKEQLVGLRRVVDEMESAARRDDHEGYHEATLRFHDTLVEFTGNAKLLQIYRRLVNELRLFRRQSLEQPPRLPGSAHEHKRILTLIATGNVDGAGEALYEHASASRARVHDLAAPSEPPLSSSTGQTMARGRGRRNAA